MAKIITDLSDFLVPKVSDYTPDFGTMKETGGLTTKEVSENIMYPLLAQRGISVTESSYTTVIARDTRFIIKEAGVTLTLGEGQLGIVIDIYNVSGGDVLISDKTLTYTLQTGKRLVLHFIEKWISTFQEDFDRAHPIGDKYYQLGGEVGPKALYNVNGIVSDWVNVSDQYAGEFFRVAGGNSGSNIVTYDNDSSVNFEHTKQNEGLPNITGAMMMYGSTTTPLDKKSGAFQDSYNTGSISSAAKEKNGGDTGVNFNASKSNAIYGANDHVTPVNSAMQIWRRIS